MWRLLSLVIVCGALWGVSLILPVTDGEQQLRSIVSIAVEPADGAAQAVTVPVNRAYLPEAAPGADQDSIDVKALVGSKPIRTEKVQKAAPAPRAKPADTVTVAVQRPAADAIPAPVAAKRPASTLAGATPLRETKPGVKLPLLAAGKAPVPAPVAAQKIELAAVPVPVPAPAKAAVKPAAIAVAANVPEPVPAPRPATSASALETVSNTVTIAISEPPKKAKNAGNVAVAELAGQDGKARRALTRALQRELVRIGCLDVGVTGSWDAATSGAMERLNSAMGGSLPADQPDPLALSAAQQYQGGCGTPAGAVQIAVAKPSAPAPIPVEAAEPAVTIALEPAAPADASQLQVAQATDLTPEPVTEPEEPLRVIKSADAVKSDAEPSDDVVQKPKQKRKLVAPRPPIARPFPQIARAVARPEPRLNRDAQRQARLLAARRARAAEAVRIAKTERRDALRVARAETAERLAARTEIRAVRAKQRSVLAQRKQRKRPLVIARRPSYQVLQASLFRPLVAVRRTTFRSLRRLRAPKAWEFNQGGLPGMPKFLR